MIGDLVTNDGHGRDDYVMVASGPDRARWPAGEPALLVGLDPSPGAHTVVVMITARLWTGSSRGPTLTPASKACRSVTPMGMVEAWT